MADLLAMSALPPKSDMDQSALDVLFVPLADMGQGKLARNSQVNSAGSSACLNCRPASWALPTTDDCDRRVCLRVDPWGKADQALRGGGAAVALAPCTDRRSRA